MTRRSVASVGVRTGTFRTTVERPVEAHKTASAFTQAPGHYNVTGDKKLHGKETGGPVRGPGHHNVTGGDKGKKHGGGNGNGGKGKHPKPKPKKKPKGGGGGGNNWWEALIAALAGQQAYGSGTPGGDTSGLGGLGAPTVIPPSPSSGGGGVSVPLVIGGVSIAGAILLLVYEWWRHKHAKQEAKA